MITGIDQAAGPGPMKDASEFVERAHQLGMYVVAEGIEKQDHFIFLDELGVDAGQGYAIGRPLPAEAVYHLTITKTPIPLVPAPSRSVLGERPH